MRVGTALSFSMFGLLVAGLGASVLACGSNSDSSSTDPGNTTSGDGGIVFGDVETPNTTYTPDQLWANDPPPPWCGPANGKPAPPPPGGTPECPDDKNREGCACKTVGETASCWPGLRVNRALGQCKDGKTTCRSKGEIDKAWGPCEGFTLPAAGAVKGAAACKCFSAGQWKLDNVVPCFANNNGDYYSTSAACNGSLPPKTVPATPWSKNSVTVDCAGRFKLCYTIKVGDAKAPTAGDCTIGSVCTEGDYLEANKPQPFPDLAGWLGTDSVCAKKAFEGSSLYGEMTVLGKSVLCDEISDNGQPLVFNRVPYCKLDCDKNPTRADCVSCQAAGSGQF